MLPAGNLGECPSVVVASGYPPLGSPLSSQVSAVELMGFQGPGLVLLLVDTVSTSPVVFVGGRSMGNRLDLVLPSVDVALTSPVSFRVVSRNLVKPPGRREGRFRCHPT